MMSNYHSKPKVKGTPDTRMILVRHRRGYKTRLIMGFVFVAMTCSALGAIGGFWYSQHARLEPVGLKNAELEQKNRELEQALLELKGRVALSQYGGELEQQTVEHVRKENLLLQKRVSELEEAVAFYKNVLAPEKNTKGLQIDSISLETTADPRRVRYKLVLTQVANNRSYVSGDLNVTLLGVQNGEKKAIALDAISSEMKKGGTKFKFRYFQDFIGELTLPEHFVPEKIQVVAKAKGRKTIHLEKLFDWKLQEASHDVGQG